MVPDVGAAAGAAGVAAGCGSWAESACLGADAGAGFLVLVLALEVVLVEVFGAALGCALGTGAAAGVSFWAKDGAAKATASRAAALANKRRILLLPGRLRGGRCGLDIQAKYYCICTICVKYNSILD